MDTRQSITDGQLVSQQSPLNRLGYFKTIQRYFKYAFFLLAIYNVLMFRVKPNFALLAFGYNY